MRILPFALTVFLSAFLLFQVQPLIGRYILPWFGGSAGVWSVTMLFFQAVLLLGYGYAHLLNTRLKPMVQAVVHLVMLGLCAVLLPIIPPEALKPEPGAQPILSILLLLGATVGAPYFALATTGPLLQAWFARAVPGKSPYPLYALSNVGSLLALLSYPFLFERVWGRHEQAVNWSWGFGLFALITAGTAVLAAGVKQADAVDTRADPRPSWRDRLLWVALPAVASGLLLSVTNQLCIDVASMPFLWVLPLSIYLLSFILTFTGRGAPRRITWFTLAGVAMAAIVWAMHNHIALSLAKVTGVYSAALLVLCILLHGETYRLRPNAARLTSFYLHVSLGGVLGGVFVAVIAPLVFLMFLELHITLLAGASALLWCLWTDPGSGLHRGAMKSVWGVLAALVLALVGGLGWHIQRKAEGSILMTRNFYGVLNVSESKAGSADTRARSLFSGTTRHGYQFMDPKHRRNRTTFYAVHSGVGVAANSLGRGPRRIGVIGLGAGVMAAYGRENAGDVVRFYEINPQCETIAREQFYFLSESYARCEVVIGDARLTLESESPQEFDLLVVDAFNSDSIPVHLLTVEAFELYLHHVKPGGGIAIHISNRHLDLRPVVRAAGVRLGLHMFAVESAADERYGAEAALWVLLSRSQSFLDAAEKELGKVRTMLAPSGKKPEDYSRRVDVQRAREIPLWTDDYSNLFDVLK